MATIGSLALQLVANPAQLVGGLDKAAAKVKSFAKVANPNSWIRGANSSIAKLGSLISGVVSPIKTLLTNIPLVGGALAGVLGSFASVAGITALLKEGMDKINEVSKAARGLGVSVEFLSGIMFTAGIPTENVTKLLAKFEKALGDAALGSSSAVTAFGRLGLSGAELAQIPMPEALGLVAERIKALKNPALQAQSAFALFGKSGFEMLPLLRKGAAGLDEAAAKAKKLGLSFSSADAEAVRQASLALKGLDKWLQSVKQALAIEFAPLLVALSEQFGEVGISGQTVASTIMKGAKIMAYAGAVVVETWKGLRLVWDLLSAGFKVMIGSFLKAWGRLLETIAQGLDILPGGMGAMAHQAAAALGDAGHEVFQGLDEQRAEVWDRLKNDTSAFDQVGAFFDGVDRKTKQIAGQVKKAAAGAQEMTDAARQFLLFEKGQNLEKELESPLQKFYTKLQEINELVSAGAISWDTYGLALTKAFEDLERGQAKMDVKAPGALELGSKEAYSAELKAQREGAGAQSAQDRIQSILKQQYAIQQQQLQTGREMVAALRGIYARGI